MSADQTEYARGETTMGEVGGGVPIGGGDDEPAKIDVRTRRRGGRHRWASPRAPSMSLCRTVERWKLPNCSEPDHSSGPTCGFVAFPKVGPEATVGTL